MTQKGRASIRLALPSPLGSPLARASANVIALAYEDLSPLLRRMRATTRSQLL